MGTLVKKSVNTQNKIDQLKKAVKIISFLNNTRLNDIETVIITHFILYGFNKVSREEILSQKLVSSYNDLANKISHLRDKGVIVKTGFKEDLSVDFSCLKNCQDKLVLMLKLDNDR